MKRIFCLMAGCILLLSACNGKAQEVNASGSENDPVAADVTAGENPAGNSDENAADKTIYGEITEVIGNSLTIKLMEMPGASPGGQMMQRGEMPESGSITLEDGTVLEWDEDNPLDMSSLPQRGNSDGSGRMTMDDGGADGSSGMTMGGGGTDGSGGMTTDGGGADGDTRRGRMMDVQRNYTGEEIEFIIPVGIPVVTSKMGENGIEETELEVSKIKAGNIITVTYQEDGKTIGKISVSQSSGSGGGMMGNGPDGSSIPANATITDFGDGRVMVTVPN